MHYVSTRDSSRRLTASQAIVEGLSRDGGLYLPESIPQLTLADIRALARLSYPERAAKIMKLYLEEFSEEELLGFAQKAYGPAKFEPPHPPPEGGDPPAQPLADKRGHPLIEPRRNNTGDIGGFRQGRTGAPRHEIGDALRRGDLMLAAVLPGQLFELLLELQPGQLAPFRTQGLEICGPHFGHHARIGIG